MDSKITKREQTKKVMTGAGISAAGVALTLFLAANNVMDIEFASAVAVGVLTAIVNALYVYTKGPKNRESSETNQSTDQND